LFIASPLPGSSGIIHGISFAEGQNRVTLETRKLYNTASGKEVFNTKREKISR
jgi:hypothetical protein